MHRIVAILFAVFCVFAPTRGWGQNRVEPADTTRFIKKSFHKVGHFFVASSKSVGHFFTADYPSPRVAAVVAIVPGLGQIYNKKWWKLPIVYGALGGMVYWELDNIKTHRELVYNYRLLKDGDPKTNPSQYPYNRLDEAAMKSYRDQFERYVELTSLGLGLVYLLTITDAFVDAHMHSFDVSDDLSLQLKPSLAPGCFGNIGLGFQLKFGKNKPDRAFISAP